MFKTSGLKAREDLRQALLDEQDRLAVVRERIRGARVAADTLDALVLAEAYLAAYRIEKASARRARLRRPDREDQGACWPAARPRPGCSSSSTAASTTSWWTRRRTPRPTSGTSCAR